MSRIHPTVFMSLFELETNVLWKNQLWFFSQTVQSQLSKKKNTNFKTITGWDCTWWVWKKEEKAKIIQVIDSKHYFIVEFNIYSLCYLYLIYLPWLLVWSVLLIAFDMVRVQFFAHRELYFKRVSLFDEWI